MNNGWQAAVVDWDRAERAYERAGNIDMADAVRNRGTNRIKNGRLCWIAFMTVEEITVNKKRYNAKKAQIWMHDAQEYNWIILEALHPLVSEKDVIEMSLKFGEDYAMKLGLGINTPPSK